MRMLTYQARHFAWQPFQKTLETAPSIDEGGEAHDAVVAWIHAEIQDPDDDSRVVRHCLKHIKWIANNKSLKTIVLHSFAHLGGDTANPDDARAYIDKLANRLTHTGYEVRQTPFGWFCAWSLSIYGDSMAKVYKAF